MGSISDPKIESSGICDCDTDTVVVSCDTTEFGCCPDGHTIAPGPNGTGCPSKTLQLSEY